MREKEKRREREEEEGRKEEEKCKKSKGMESMCLELSYGNCMEAIV